MENEWKKMDKMATFLNTDKAASVSSIYKRSMRMFIRGRESAVRQMVSYSKVTTLSK